MEPNSKELAAVGQAKAYFLNEILLVRITGEKPSGCHVVSLEQSLLTVEPPGFIATWFIPPNVRCVPGAVPYEHQQLFRIGVRRDVVTVHHAAGEYSVEVEDLHDEIVDSAPMELEAKEAVGFSDAYDFTEAFRDAIDQIEVPPLPDWRATYTVLEIGAEVGGIIPLNRMFVRIRGG